MTRADILDQTLTASGPVTLGLVAVQGLDGYPGVCSRTQFLAPPDQPVRLVSERVDASPDSSKTRAWTCAATSGGAPGQPGK